MPRIKKSVINEKLVSPSLETVLEISQHPNAARLVLVKISGFEKNIIVNKKITKVGDKVVFFPIGSIIPNSIDNIVSTHRYVGKRQKVKKMSFRGVDSYGVVFPVSSLLLDFQEQVSNGKMSKVPEISDNKSLHEFIEFALKEKVRAKRLSHVKMNKFSMILDDEE